MYKCIGPLLYVVAASIAARVDTGDAALLAYARLEAPLCNEFAAALPEMVVALRNSAVIVSARDELLSGIRDARTHGAHLSGVTCGERDYIRSAYRTPAPAAGRGLACLARSGLVLSEGGPLARAAPSRCSEWTKDLYGVTLAYANAHNTQVRGFAEACLEQ